jgi:hypothetical protein
MGIRAQLTPLRNLFPMSCWFFRKRHLADFLLDQGTTFQVHCQNHKFWFVYNKNVRVIVIRVFGCFAFARFLSKHVSSEMAGERDCKNRVLLKNDQRQKFPINVTKSARTEAMKPPLYWVTSARSPHTEAVKVLCLWGRRDYDTRGPPPHYPQEREPPRFLRAQRALRKFLLFFSRAARLKKILFFARSAP